jgi:hypothetical protein
METLADKGDGNYYYIDSLDEARRVLVDRMTSTMEVVAKDVKVQVEWSSVVQSYRLVGYENRAVADASFRDDATDGGEIGSDHQVTAIYEVVLAPSATGDLATVRIRSKAPGPDSPSAERTYALPAVAVRSSLAEASDDLRIAVAAASFAEVLRGSDQVHLDLARVERMARAARRPEYSEDAELITLVERAEALRVGHPYTAVHASGGPLTVTIPPSEPFTTLYVACASQSALRASFVGGVATIPHVPDESCTMSFKGGLPAMYRPVRGGQSLSCSFVGATATCTNH